MSEMMDFDDYPRDRSRSPSREYNGGEHRRERSHSPRRDGGNRNYHSTYRSAPRRDYYPRQQRPTYAQRASEYEIKANRKYENSIFVGNLPYDVQWYELKDHFAAAGPIVRADIVTNHGKPRGMGTVEYQTREVAQRAINMFDRTEFKDREIFVREDLPPPEKKESFRPERHDRDRYPRQDRFSRDRYDRNDRYDSYSRYSGYGRQNDRYQRDVYTPGPPRREQFRREPSKGYEVFVGNIPFNVKWQDLKDLFRECGEIERADIIENSYGKSRGMGTVHFYELSDAEAAIDKFNGFDWFGRRIEVRKSKFPREGDDSASNIQSRSAETPHIRTDGLSKNTEFTLGVSGDGPPSDTLFVANLPWETAESDLFELFGSVSTVVKAELQYGRGGRSAGNAVVQFADMDDARSVIEQLNDYEYGNRHLRISFAKLPSPEHLAALQEEINNSNQAAEAAANAAVANVAEHTTNLNVGIPTEPAGFSAPLEQSSEQPVEVIDDGDEIIEE